MKLKTPLSILAIILVSIIAILLLFWVIYAKHSTQEAFLIINPWAQELITRLDFFNALMNSISTLCLICGLRAILRKNQQDHKKWMIRAFLSSSLFLVSYIIYHYFHGDTHFVHHVSAVRFCYFFILFSHILLSIFALPLILITFYFSLTGKFVKHKKLARYTFPIWLYVSSTGVVVFLMLKILNETLST